MSRVARLAALCVVLCVLAGVSSFTFKPRGRGVSRQNRLISKSATSFEIHYDDDSSEAESMSSSELGRRKQTSEQIAVAGTDILLKDISLPVNVIVQLGQGEPKTGPARKSSEQILALVADTEAGLSASDDVKKECADWIQNKLSITRGVSVGKELLLGNYEVSFVGELSIEQKDRGNPAGGQFRGKIGRFLFRTDGLYQHILDRPIPITAASTAPAPEKEEKITAIGIDNREGESQKSKKIFENEQKLDVVNYVSGRLFSCLPLDIILYGKIFPLTPIEIQESIAPTARKQGLVLSDSTVKAVFDQPKITLKIGLLIRSLLRTIGSWPITYRLNQALFSTSTIRGGDESHVIVKMFLRIVDALNVTLRVGPKSTVVLDSPYVDERLRVGLGSRGSQFLFRRISPIADITDTDTDTDKSSLFQKSEGWRLKSTVVDATNFAIVLAAAGIYSTVLLKKRTQGIVLSVAGVLLGMWKGGVDNIDDTEEDAKSMISNYNYNAIIVS